MASIIIPPIKTPIAHPRAQPLVLPPQLDPSCVLCLLPLRDNKWFDYSGHGNHGTFYGAGFTAKGRYGPTVAFDGKEDYVNVGKDASLDITAAITIEAWVKAKAGHSHMGIWYDQYTDYRSRLLVMATNRVTVQYSLSTGDLTVDTAVGIISDDIWAHIVATFDGTYGRVYIDGELKATTEKVGTISLSTNNRLIGRGTALAVAYWFDGLIDEFRLYNQALTPLAIKALYELGRVK